MGHYICGTDSGATVRLPIFIPIGPLTIGMTYVRPEEKSIKTAYIAGPICGLITGVMCLAFSVLINPAYVFICCVYLGMQLVSFALGSDLKLYRKL